jgi:hypothetical protein
MARNQFWENRCEFPNATTAPTATPIAVALDHHATEPQVYAGRSRLESPCLLVRFTDALGMYLAPNLHINAPAGAPVHVVILR